MKRTLPVWILLVAAGPALAQGEGLVQRIDPRAEVAPVTTRSAGHVEGKPVVRKPRTRAEHSVIIEAPVAEVWAYLSDNTKARDWSIFFHHITSLDDLDGAVGATRRCFVFADETGRYWDETVVGTEFHRTRHIDMYDIVGYKVPGSNTYHYDVWQLYEALGPSRTKLTFRTAPAKGSGFGQHLVWAVSRRKTNRIFKANLENIKAAIEQGDAYERIHAYDPD
jgi:hypothetical protein